MELVLLYFAMAYVLWILFLDYCSLANKWDILSTWAKALGLPIVIAGLVVDCVFNVFSSIPFLDPPREYTFTQRMSRYTHDVGNWRTPIAEWICGKLLDPFQNGGHCH